MSVLEGHLNTLPQGPLRPIPIHPPCHPGLDYRIPIQVHTDKSDKPKPSLWNPALDLSPPSKNPSNKDDSKTQRGRKSTLVSAGSGISDQPSHPSLNSSSLKSPVMPTSTQAPNATIQKHPAPLVSKAPQLIRPTLYEQLNRQMPAGMEMLASKGAFFSSLSGNQAVLHPHPGHLTHPSHTHTHPLLLLDRHISIQNALAIAQSRSVMERLSAGHPQLPMRGMDHTHQQPHQQPQQQVQRHQPQQTSANQPPCHAHQAPLTERPMALQNVLALAQSRALMERVGSSPMLSPILSMDNPANHSYGRKLFPCPQCRYTTDRRNNLKRHMLTMHQTSSKMLECCGILFSTKASLREHAVIFHYHGYTCYFCGRRFCRKALLKRHLSVHNGQKDFVCNVCDYATSHKSNLERHRKVHSRQDDGKDGDEERRYHDDDAQHYHDDIKSNGSEAVSHDDVSSDDLSVCSDFDDDIDVEINVHSD